MKGSSSNAASPSQFKASLSRSAPTSAPVATESSNEGFDPSVFEEGIPESALNDEIQVNGGGDEHEEVVEESFDEEDISWLDAIKPHKQLHGLELSDIVAALAEGRLPPELAKNIKMQFKNGEEVWEGTFEQARKEHMLHRDYTQKTQRFNEEKAAYEGDKGEFLQMLHTWKSNPEALLSGLERMQFPMLEAAKLLAARIQKLESMTPQERQLYEEKQKFEEERRTFQREQQKLNQTKQQAETAVAVKGYQDIVQNTAQKLFQQSGIPHNENTWRLFLHNFETYTTAGHDWNAETAQLAFEAMADDYNSVLAKRQRAQQQAVAPKPAQEFSSPAREQVVKSGIVKQVQKGANRSKGGAMTPGDFKKMLQGR